MNVDKAKKRLPQLFKDDPAKVGRFAAFLRRLSSGDFEDWGDYVEQGSVDVEKAFVEAAIRKVGGDAAADPGTISAGAPAMILMGKDEIPMTVPLLSGRFFDVGAFEKERNLEVMRAAITACPAGQNPHGARPRALDRMSATWYPQVPEGHMLWLDCRRAGNVPSWPTLASLAVRAVLTFTSYEA
ncbi:hypothetical protein GPECTOR_692g834 [Gonium pectorale]|uniref:Uncharacterized protein n=1 Tax=Gonium pectorale TaxID=33097 RepID=A0A150FU62_GONPE|nr:hypothetical protein GPECTOR_692g834 [Gonium pectorale]|eukprot:KXZ41173.1 hypothetical protein GPECTOR_692g834 [Gonium pectorale]